MTSAVTVGQDVYLADGYFGRSWNRVAAPASAAGRKYQLPSYPAAMNLLRLAGQVQVRVHIANGSVARIETLGFEFYETKESKEGPPRITPQNLIYPAHFREVVEAAVQTWEFPRVGQGSFEVRFMFELSDELQPDLHEKECVEVESQYLPELDRLVSPKTVRITAGRTGRVVHID